MIDEVFVWKQPFFLQILFFSSDRIDLLHLDCRDSLSCYRCDTSVFSLERIFLLYDDNRNNPYSYDWDCFLSHIGGMQNEGLSSHNS